MRHVEFLDEEIAEVERLVARQMLSCSDARRLMSVPGVNVICAASFLAAIGDIRRFKTSRQLAAYLGLDPKVRQSGSQPARSGRISKQGSASARWALVEAAFSVVRQPGPLHAFYERLRVRRGHQIAVVASARKLACLFWCLLTREEQYAHQQPSLTAKKLRRLELTAGAHRYDSKAAGVWSTNQAMRNAERKLAEQAEASYVRMVSDWQATAPRRLGASVTPGRPQQGRQTTSPRVCASTRHRLAPNAQPTTEHDRTGRPPDTPAATTRAQNSRICADPAVTKPKPTPQEPICRPQSNPRDRSTVRNQPKSWSQPP
jgi:hypothetical protein